VSVAVIAAVVVTLSLTPRILGAVGVLPPALLTLGWSDVLATWNDSRLPGHRIPYLDVAFAYPPAVGYIAGLISLLGDGFLAYAVLWGVVMALGAAAGAYVFARHAGPGRALLYWACAPQMLLLAGINFDVLAALCLGIAAIAARRRDDLRAGGWLAIGAATKLFPAICAPVYVWWLAQRSTWRRAAAAAAVFGAVLVALYLPAAVAPFPATRFVGAYAFVAANIDSPWVLVERAVSATGMDGRSVVLVLTAAGFGLTYVGLVMPRARIARDPVIGFGLATVTLLLWSRLYSPQYSLWLLPFFVLLPLRRRSFVLLSIADVGVFFTIYPLTLMMRETDPLWTTFLAALFVAIALRLVALVVIWRDLSRLAHAIGDGAEMARTPSVPERPRRSDQRLRSRE
jgi:hypothetical protein